MPGNQYSNAKGWKPTIIQCKTCGIDVRIKPCKLGVSKFCSIYCSSIDKKGKKQPKDLVEKRAISNRGQKRSLEVRKKLSVGKLREKNPQWKGGISKKEKYSVESAEKRRYGMTKKEALKILGSKCLVCGMDNKESLKKWNKNLVIHHKDGQGRNTNNPNNKLNNLEIVCVICHGKKHLTKEKAIKMNKLSQLNR